MGDRTKIEWTEATWNPLRGCSRVSEGCRHCYAERQAARFSGPGLPYEGLIHPKTHGWNGQVRVIEEAMALPLQWQRPRRIFVNSMSDLFHESVPDAVVDHVFAVMALAHWHTFQILTKRPERMRDYLQSRTAQIQNDLLNSDMAKAIRMASHNAGHRLPGNAVLEFINNDDSWRAQPDTVRRTPGWPLRHVWIGVSVESQETANTRVPALLQTPAAVRWLSCEPLLGPVDLEQLPTPFQFRRPPFGWATWLSGQLDWIVVGGESGAEARPMHPEWACALRDQCSLAGIPYFFKQWGDWAPDNGSNPRRMFVYRDGSIDIPDYRAPDSENDGETAMAKIGKKHAGRKLDGVEHNAYPLPADGVPTESRRVH